MIFSEIESNEWRLIEEYNIFNGRQYARKQYAYKKRAQSIATHIDSEWLEMCSFFGFVCCNCESEVIGGIPNKDHIYPISLGGSDSIRNVQPLCRNCNTSKFINVIDYREYYCQRHNILLPDKWRYDG